MGSSKKLAQAALASILSLTATHDVFAQAATKEVQCYGIAEAGKNACAVTNYVACAGQIKEAHACYAWIVAKDAATCVKQGGSVGKPVTGCVAPSITSPTALSPAPTSSETESTTPLFSTLKKWL